MDSMVGNEWMEVFSEELINLNMYFFCTCNSFLNNFVCIISNQLIENIDLYFSLFTTYIVITKYMLRVLLLTFHIRIKNPYP